MVTEIRFNGSRWAGEPPATIDELLELLAREPLNPQFEHYGDFATSIQADGCEWSELKGGTLFSGNFLNVSHAFGIETNDPDVEAKLFAAIKANKQRADYRAARVEFLATCRCRACRPDPNATTKNTKG